MACLKNMAVLVLANDEAIFLYNLEKLETNNL